MSRDEELRELERAWLASPQDQVLLGALINARRRASLVIPASLADAVVCPPRGIEGVPAGFELGYVALGGELERVAAVEHRRDVSLPAHRRWWLRLTPQPEEWSERLAQLLEFEPLGLHLDARHLPRQVPEVGRLTNLRELVLCLPNGTYLEYDAPGRNWDRGEGASLSFLLSLRRLERLEVYCFTGFWQQTEFLTKQLFFKNEAKIDAWPLLRHLRIDRFPPGPLPRCTLGFNNHGPAMGPLTTLPSLDRLELRGWIFDSNDLADLASSTSLRTLRLEEPLPRDLPPAPAHIDIELLGEPEEGFDP